MKSHKYRITVSYIEQLGLRMTLHAGTKQLVAIVVGGIAGAMCVVGGAMLLYRRLANPRVKASSSMMDTLILGLIVLQACLGMVTIIFSLGVCAAEVF